MNININNIVHSIHSEEEYAELDRCLAVLETLSSVLEEKYETDFEYWEPTFPTHKVFEHYFYMSSGDYFGIECIENDDLSVAMRILLASDDFIVVNNEFYKAGL